MLQRLLTLILLTGLYACAPTHNIRPYPDFIQSGVKVGDRVEVQTVHGETHEFKVTSLNKTELGGGEKLIPYRDIETISKKSWATPEHPCDDKRPLGCSIPQLIRLIDGVDENTMIFEPVCVQHDFCYRHGFKTYGKDRKTCDDAFRVELKQQCEEPKWLSALSLTLNKRKCLAIANQMYQAVRRYGEDRFMTKTGSYCEYDGPVSSLNTIILEQ